MKIRIVIAFILLFLCCDVDRSLSFDKWTTEDTVWEATTLAIKSLDWANTRYIASHSEKYWEISPLIGKYPTDGEVNSYFAATTALHIVVAVMLPTKVDIPIIGNVNPRRLWQYVFIGISGALVKHNMNIGIGMKW